MNEFDKANKQDVSKGSNRRSFLKKSATGAVVFSLPAKSVWGACSVSGAMSGNLSTNTDRHDCTLPAFANGAQGASAAVWISAETSDATLNELFGHLALSDGQPNYPTLSVSYRDHVNITKGLSLGLPNELVVSPTVGDALLNGSTELQNLAAVFLNATYGLYSTWDSALAQQLVNDIFLYIYTNEAQGTPVTPLLVSDYGITDPHATSPLVLPG